MSIRYINFFIVVLLLLSVTSHSMVKASYEEESLYSETEQLFYIGLERPCGQRLFFNGYQYSRAVIGCNTESRLQTVVFNLNEKSIKASLEYNVTIERYIYKRYFSDPFIDIENYELFDKEIDQMHYILDNTEHIFTEYTFPGNTESLKTIHYYCRERIKKYKSEFEYYPYLGLGKYFGSSRIIPTQEQIKYTENLISMCEKADMRFRRLTQEL